REARFPLIEAFGMKSLFERKQLVVEMVAKLMDEGSQERLERDDLSARRGAHPDSDPRFRASFLRLVQSVQLAIVTGRPLCENPDADRRHLVSIDQHVDQTLTGDLHAGAIFR